MEELNLGCVKKRRYVFGYNFQISFPNNNNKLSCLATLSLMSTLFSLLLNRVNWYYLATIESLEYLGLNIMNMRGFS